MLYYIRAFYMLFRSLYYLLLSSDASLTRK